MSSLSSANLTLSDSVAEGLRPELDLLWHRFEEQCEAEQPGIVALACAREELPAVWACSEFVALNCIRNPTILADLINSGDLDSIVDPEALRNDVLSQLHDCPGEDELDRRLRRIRNREMVRMAWRDLAGFAQLEETMAGVSALAEAAIDGALDLHDGWLAERFGVPRDELGTRVRMVVLGLGKLGGAELNYSSDIDLIFAFDGAGETDGPRVVSNQEYFIKLGRKIVNSLDRATADGFVFRTDMRLRPNGDSGPLVLSFAAMEHYYQAHGRDWERYALIKARVVGGDRESGAALVNLFNPFIYRKYLDFGAFDSIREMKRLIERELQKKGMQDNIKLGRGGIREIEFLVQSHQLIRGGRERGLRTTSLYRALAELVKLGVIDEAESSRLLDDYRFLRNTEHRLQMYQDRQTQQLPADEIGRQRLAWSMGSESWETWHRCLQEHRENVHRLFTRILDPSADDETEQAGNGGEVLRDVWLDLVDEADACRHLQSAGIGNPQKVQQLLREFRRGRLYQAFSGIDRDRIDRLLPLAIDEAGQRDNAERALTSFVSVIESIGRRSVYLSLLIENPRALSQLLTLCAASPWIARHIGANPVIMDELLNPPVDVRLQTHEDVRGELYHRLGQLDVDDEEGRMNAMREFNHAQVLRVAAADVSGVLHAADVCAALTRLAEVILNHLFAEALRVVEVKLGAQPGEAGVIAYGKFGTGELGYHSDLDIVVCFRHLDGGSGASRSQTEYYYSRVGQRLIHLLTTRTLAGQLYELDMRLRPSGRSGTLVTSLDGFLDYQLNSAWTWEHQALVRARPVAGSEPFSAAFERVREEILCQPRDGESLRGEIIEMKQKMMGSNCASTAKWYDIKLDRGGIVDIEFLVQYLVLANAARCRALIVPRTTEQQITALQGNGIISPETAEVLRRSYLCYLRESLNDKLMDQPVRVPQESLLEERRAVIDAWSRTFG